MSTFKLYRDENKYKGEERIDLKKGYSFNKKVKVKIYDKDILRGILKKKMNISLKKIIEEYKDTSESGEDTTNLLEPIEKLKYNFVKKYSKYFTKEDIIKYADRLNKLENKCAKKKNRSR